MTRAPRPPRLARLLASIAIRGDAREVILGDLDQEFHEAIARTRAAPRRAGCTGARLSPQSPRFAATPAIDAVRMGWRLCAGRFTD
jgi:hypothetical protein